jgi:endonuclease G, mitochondrial
MTEKVTRKTTAKPNPLSIGVFFLDLAKTAATSVGRIVRRNRGFEGTGFIISNCLFLTSNHVLVDSSHALNSLVEFNVELSPDRLPKPITAFSLAPDDFFMSSPREDLDFTIVAIGDRVLGSGRLSDFGHISLSNNDSRGQLGRFVNIIHHPVGDYKQIILGAQLASHSEEVLHYYASTQSGSSGAPVFNEKAELIGIHHYRRPTRPSVTPDGKPGPRDTNEGIRISAIVKRMNSEKKNLNKKQRDLVERI